MTNHDDDGLPERIRALAGPLADELGVELLEVDVQGARGRRLVRVVADLRVTLPVELGADEQAPGVDLDVIAELSRDLGDLLDEQDLIAGAHTLEVSSPGAASPLRRAQDFARNLGRPVRLVWREGVTHPELDTATVVAVRAESIVVQAGDERHDLDLDTIDHATVVLPW